MCVRLLKNNVCVLFNWYMCCFIFFLGIIIFNFFLLIKCVIWWFWIIFGVLYINDVLFKGIFIIFKVVLGNFEVVIIFFLLILVLISLLINVDFLIFVVFIIYIFLFFWIFVIDDNKLFMF